MKSFSQLYNLRLAFDNYIVISVILCRRYRKAGGKDAFQKNLQQKTLENSSLQETVLEKSQYKTYISVVIGCLTCFVWVFSWVAVINTCLVQ